MDLSLPNWLVSAARGVAEARSATRCARPAPTRRSSDGRLRVMLIAEGCNPDMISVPLVGFSQACQIRRMADTLVVTHPRNREALMRGGWLEHQDFACIDTEWIARWAWSLGERLAGKGKGWTLQAALYTPTYYLFEHLLWQQFGARIEGGEFDLVHRIIPLSPTVPSLIASRCRRAGVPFILGPINGGVSWPRQFDAARRKEREWLSYVRGAYQLLPGYRSMRRDASAMLIASRATWEQMPRQFLDRCFYLPENAIDPDRFSMVRAHRAQRPIRAVFVGRLVPYKGADMLIEAVAPLVRNGDLTLDIIGDGPMRGELAELVARLGAQDGIRFAGWVEHGKVQQWLAKSDVFAFPSVREFGGAVALEAMAVGSVPIVLDYGGPAELVSPRTGFLVPMGTRQEIVERFRSVLERVVADPAQIESRSAAGIRRARTHFTWEEKAKRTMEVYQWVLDPSRPKPAFAMPEPDA